MNIWDGLHQKYQSTDWIDKPSFFSQEAIQYFPKKGKLLELGAGQGQDSRFFASHGYKIISTDVSDFALNLSQGKTKTNLKDNISWQQIDISQPLPFNDNSFDIVYSHLAVHYFDKKITQQIFSEIYRVLKPNGIVALLTNSVSDPEYGTGKKLEEDFFELDAHFKKHFFSVLSIKKFAKLFEIIVTDNHGVTYKDRAKGVENLIRFIGKKPISK